MGFVSKSQVVVKWTVPCAEMSGEVAAALVCKQAEGMGPVSSLSPSQQSKRTVLQRCILLAADPIFRTPADLVDCICLGMVLWLGRVREVARTQARYGFDIIVASYLRLAETIWGRSC